MFIRFREKFLSSGNKFANGDPITEAKTDKEWKEEGDNGKLAWCYYNNDPENGKRYRKLYNWYAVNDPRGLCPDSWHVARHDKWMALTDIL